MSYLLAGAAFVIVAWVILLGGSITLVMVGVLLAVLALFAQQEEHRRRARSQEPRHPVVHE